MPLSQIPDCLPGTGPIMGWGSPFTQSPRRTLLLARRAAALPLLKWSKLYGQTAAHCCQLGVPSVGGGMVSPR